MGLFAFSKKKKGELTEAQLKWNKMWQLWAEGHADSPYAELMNLKQSVFYLNAAFRFPPFLSLGI